MKISILLLAVALLSARTAVSLASSNGVVTGSANPSGYDFGLLPATAEQIREEIDNAGDDQLALYDAVYHAGRNGLELTALNELLALQARHPNDAVILAACSLAYGVAKGYFGLNGYHSVLSNFDSKDQILYGNDLAKAAQLNPNLWLVFLVKAQPAIFPGIGSRQQALIDLQKAVRLGPLVPYTHYTLAYFLSTPNATAEEQQDAISQAKSATRLKPIYSQAAFLLFEIYGIDLHDREDGLAYKQMFLSEIPPGYKLSDAAAQLLANFPK